MNAKSIIRPVHTYSIVACDAEKGEIGVAVQSHWFSVGSVVPWAEAGTGAVATQAFANISFGPGGLELLKKGKTADQAIEELIDADESRDMRQLAVIDAGGNAAAYTGRKCIPAAGHYVGKNFSVQANMMLNERVWPEMADSFKKNNAPLAERLIAALEAAQQAGGDIRGKQSASLLIVKARPTGKMWEDRAVDLRVEDNPEPVKELKRLLKVFRAYEHMNRGDEALEKSDTEGALKEYGKAQEICPENLEMKYWYAVSMANAGGVKDSLPIFKEIVSQNRNWLILTKRLPDVGLLKVNERDFELIVNQ